MTAEAHTEALLEALRRNLHVLNELAVRYEVETDPGRADGGPFITGPEDVRKLLGEEMGALCQEQVRILLLDRRNCVVGQRVIYQGNVFSSVVRPAEVLRPAVVEGIPNLIVAHNHPSGGARLMMMAAQAAVAVARFQFKPRATTGTIAAAKVLQPKTPRMATSRSFT